MERLCFLTKFRSETEEVDAKPGHLFADRLVHGEEGLVVGQSGQSRVPALLELMPVDHRAPHHERIVEKVGRPSGENIFENGEKAVSARPCIAGRMKLIKMLLPGENEE